MGPFILQCEADSTVFDNIVAWHHSPESFVAVADKNGDNAVSYSEMSSYLTFNLGQDKEEVDQLSRRLDLNQDRLITVDELPF